MGRLIAIDTNLLVLLVVGSASVDFIARHKRKNTFVKDDFRLLRQILLDADGIVFTPHVLSETSNLVRQFAKPGVDTIVSVLGRMIQQSREIAVASADAVQRPEFRYLGLTDAGLPSIDADDVALLTDDFDLYRASLAAGRKPINFSHARESWLGL